MKADNSKTGHNRTIKVTGIPTDEEHNQLPELTILVNYDKYKDGGPSDGEKAVALDRIVVPSANPNLSTRRGCSSSRWGVYPVNILNLPGWEVTGHTQTKTDYRIEAVFTFL